MAKKHLLLTNLFFIPLFIFSQWTQIGGELNGAENERFGSYRAIDLDDNGTTLAVGTPFNSDNGDFSGFVEVYELVNSEWVIKGERIEGITMDDTGTEGTGASVGLNADGSTLAVGISHGHNSLGYRCGVVQVYDWDGTAWVLRGETIEGEGNPSPLFETDVFGSALRLSADGNHIVVGATGNSPEVGVLQISGHVRVFSWDGTQWVQKGIDIDGVDGLEEFGYSVSINDAGNIIAVGARGHRTIVAGGGAAYVFEWDGTNWVQRGDTFLGTELGDFLGSAVRLDKTGNTFALGTPKSSNQNSAGSTKIFDWDGTAWVQRGQEILGTVGSQSGSAIDLSPDGNIIAIGEPWENSVEGQVRVFQWNGTTWELVDSPIDGIGPSNGINAAGRAVALNKDGSRVAIGAPSVNDNGFSSGQIRVFLNETLVNLDDLVEEEILQIFPNPTTDHLKITSSNLMEQVTLYNNWGQKLMEITIDGQEIDLDLRQLPSGNYFAVILSKNKFNTVKISKI